MESRDQGWDRREEVSELIGFSQCRENFSVLKQDGVVLIECKEKSVLRIQLRRRREGGKGERLT